MNKKTFVLMGTVLAVFALAVPATAVDETFTVTASVPQATGVSISAARVDSSTNEFTPVAGTTLNFNPLTFNSELGIWLPDHFFAVDVGAVGGAGAPDVTVTYTEGANPNDPDNGLGWKSTATFVQVTGEGEDQTETALTAHGPKKLLKDVNGELINDTEIQGGFLRIYLGIVTNDPNATFPDPAGAENFTNEDAPGDYDGTLLVSATIS
jgi:hypothetical protein